MILLLLDTLLFLSMTMQRLLHEYCGYSMNELNNRCALKWGSGIFFGHSHE